MGVNLPGEILRQLGARAGDTALVAVENGVMHLVKATGEQLEAALRERAGGEVKP